MRQNHRYKFLEATTKLGVAVCLMWPVTGSVTAQISPGDLSTVHQESSGIDHCTDCHKAGSRPPEFNCLVCHREIEERLDQGRGYHAVVAERDKSGRRCVECHDEHNGKDFKLVRWELFERDFDHEESGYSLTGKHGETSCRKCHRPEHILEEAAKVISIRDKSRTYLGISTQCSACHQDVHAGQLPPDCGECHTPSGWIDNLLFDHAKARFPLDGAHASVLCEKCHLPAAGPNAAIKYTDIPFDDCTPCHQNPHGDAFQDSCHTCHPSAENWKAVGSMTNFNHARTPFPLLGKHAEVGCSSCHPDDAFSIGLEFSDCRDCHRRDPHMGQFDDRADGGKCDTCHNEDGFKPAIFGVREHEKSGFPLKGSHVQTPCSECHKADTRGTVYRMRDLSCKACHQDPHGAQFSEEPYRNRCENCHNEETFKPSDFNRDSHAETRFPLSGGHREVSCRDCHKPAEPYVQYTFEDPACTQCHEDPHLNQFASYTDSILESGLPAGCTACHTTDSWGALDGFDHSKTEFPLLGAHASVECSECHVAPASGETAEGILYSSAPDRCSGCHADPHMSQFSGWMADLNPAGAPVGCVRCHGQTSWDDLPGFDHTDTVFPLEGAHKEVACHQCHPARSLEKGTSGIRYGEAPLQCSGCHDDPHGGQFLSENNLTGCAECHSTVKWSPPEFDHNTQSDYVLEGAHRDVPCRMCHNKSTEIEGKKVTIYRRTPNECSDCHGMDPEAR